MQPDRLVIVLASILLLIPGSPISRFDGLPLANKAEVFAFGLILLMGTSRQTRTVVSALTSRGSRRQWFVLFVVVLAILKTLMFFRFPLGERFETCIRGTYRPVEQVCEKSFDRLFGSNDGVNARGAITRVDESVNFQNTTGDPKSLWGASRSTWNLPFQNEFPRFGELWLDRLPFSARVGAVIAPQQKGFVPVEFVGRVTATASSAIVQDESYGTRKVLLVPVPAGRQDFVIDFEFRDDNASEVPDEAPPVRGPYAHLIAGAPIDLDSQNQLRMVIRGWAFRTGSQTPFDRVVIRSASGDVAANEEKRNDVALYYGLTTLADSGFEIFLNPKTALRNLESFQVVGQSSNGAEVVLARVDPPNWISDPSNPRITRVADSEATVDLQSWFVLSDKPALLEAEGRSPLGSGWVLIKWALEALQFAMFILAPVYLLIRRSKDSSVGLFRLMVISGLTIVMAWLVYTYSYFWPLRLLPAPLLLATILVISLRHVHRQIPQFTIGFIGIVSGVLSWSISLSMIRRVTGLGEFPNWWNFALFRSRDSDWFIFQGYAYKILVEQSFRGGEGIFYFMPGARYVIFLYHIIFGNNDIFIAIVVQTLLVVSSLLFCDQLIRASRGRETINWLPILAGIISVSVSVVPLVTQLAISSASEVFAWTAFNLALALIAYMSYQQVSSGIALAVGSLLGSVIFLRPNYLMASGLIAVFALMLTWIRSRNYGVSDGLATCTWLIVGFGVFSSLALAHNLYYGEEFNFFTNRADPAQTLFEPTELFRFFSSSDVREETATKFQLFFYWRPPSLDPFLIASWASQALFVVAVVRWWRNRRRLVSLTLLCAPIAYVVSSIPFGIMTIPERQFTMATLSLVASASFSLVQIGLVEKQS